MNSDLRLLARSLPYLRPIQIPERALRLAAEAIAISEPVLRSLGRAPRLAETPAAPSPRSLLWDARLDEAARVASDAVAGRFEAIGVARDYGESVWWNDPTVPRLFRFSLHSFDVAWAMATDGGAHGRALARLIERWAADNPPRRSDAWHPFVIAQRLVNLLGTREAWLPHASLAVLDSLWRQARLLPWILERDVGGNHLIREATALVVAGSAFGDATLTRRGTGVLAREVARQILPDGGHCERTPSYHLEVLTDLAEVRRLLPLSAPLLPLLDRSLARMATFAASMLHPDGHLPLFNDCWTWPVPVPRYLTSLGLPAEVHRWFPVSGYARLGGRDDVMFVDVGRPSPPDLPAHAHSDLLSFEVSVSGRRLLVNSGTGDYERGAWRDYWRSTRAHNTIEVDGADQSETWHSFRMGRRANVLKVHAQHEVAFDAVTACHDGYLHLPRPVVHKRSVVRLREASLVVDMLSGDGTHRVRSFLHAHPDAEVTVRGKLGLVTRGSAGMTVLSFGPLPLRACSANDHPIDNWHAERLGDRSPSTALVAEGDLVLPATLGWVLLPPGAEIPEVGVEERPEGIRVRFGSRTVVIGTGARPVEVVS